MHSQVLLGTSVVLSTILSITTYLVWEPLYGPDVYYLMSPPFLAIAISLFQIVHQYIYTQMYTGLPMIVVLAVLKGWHWTLSGGFLMWLVLEIFNKLRGDEFGIFTLFLIYCIPQMLAALAEYHVLSAILDRKKERRRTFLFSTQGEPEATETMHDVEVGQGLIFLPASTQDGI
jgi:hypothetical protein